MNKFIKNDLRDATSLMKAAIMNTLHDIDSGEETYINLGPNLSNNILMDCLNEAKWDYKLDNKWESPSGKLVLIEEPIFVGNDFEFKVLEKVLETEKEINISVSFSFSDKFYIPKNIDITNQEALKEFIKDKIYLPQNALADTGIDDFWTLDEYNIYIEI